jgi:hypothetical protein
MKNNQPTNMTLYDILRDNTVVGESFYDKIETMSRRERERFQAEYEYFTNSSQRSSAFACRNNTLYIRHSSDLT